MVDWAHLAVIWIFLLLIASLIAWIKIYRGLDQADPPSSPGYRTHQWLIALITLLTFLLVLLIVFSSDPGNTDEELFWY